MMLPQQSLSPERLLVLDLCAILVGYNLDRAEARQLAEETTAKAIEICQKNGRLLRFEVRTDDVVAKRVKRGRKQG